MAKKQILLTGLNQFKRLLPKLDSINLNFELELLTTAILVSSVLHIKVEYN